MNLYRIDYRYGVGGASKGYRASNYEIAPDELAARSQFERIEPPCQSLKIDKIVVIVRDY